ncbi:MAG TPA: CehA/McbA family metallohydrolase [Gemmataceae bacterium]|nr:CehA/McbA family metallohydrolase [Gemmataceae bacterium]
MTDKLHTVHVRVNDAATGQPTPVRIHFASPAGTYCAPLGHPPEFATGEGEDVGGNLLLGSKRYAYIDGTCEIRLPAGPLVIEIHKGTEYKPQHIETVLPEGKLALRYGVERWTDLRREGWYSAETRAHYLTPHAALLEGAAEDLAVVNLLAEAVTVRHCDDGHFFLKTPVAHLPEYPAFPNLLAFSGQQPCLERPGHMVVVNTHNVHRTLGSVALLHCHRVVHPLVVDWDEGLGDWALADWCDQCRRKGGLTVCTSLFDSDFGGQQCYGEILAALILAKMDAIELDAFSQVDEKQLEDHWYTFLNAGCRTPLTGAGGKASNATLLGAERTYARLRPGEPLTYGAWIEAVRAGRTFITNGPLLSFTVNGHDPGAIIDLPSLDQPVHIAAEARSWLPFDQLEVVLNGNVLLQAKADGSPTAARSQAEVRLPEAGWLAARCSGSHTLVTRTGWVEHVGAHTSPVYVEVGGRPAPADKAAVTKLVDQLTQMLGWVERQGPPGNGRRHDHIAGIFRSARDVLQRRVAQ